MNGARTRCGRHDGVLLFQLLQALLESAPRVLSKAELQQLPWPDTLVVDTNLSNLIGEVRTAIGDDPRKPRFIRTVHRFGYAFRGGPEARSPAARPGTARVRLKWPGGWVELGEGEHIIGRDPEVAVCLASSSVSRRHAVLRIRNDEVTLRDLAARTAPPSMASASKRLAPSPMATRSGPGRCASRSV